MSISTIGHSEAYGGLRGHSIGDIYPMIVVCVGTRWHVQHPHHGLLPEGYDTATMAYSHAQACKRHFTVAKACCTILGIE